MVFGQLAHPLIAKPPELHLPSPRGPVPERNAGADRLRLTRHNLADLDRHPCARKSDIEKVVNWPSRWTHTESANSNYIPGWH
jgi:hypothetical protein